MRIVSIQTLFAINNESYEANIKSIESFGKYILSNPYNDIEFIFAGYVAERYMFSIVELIRKYFKGRSKIFRVDKNYGKAYVINKVASEYLRNHPDTEKIFTFDHDIVFINDEQNKDMFNRLIKVSEQLSKIQNRQFGILALSLKQNDIEHPNASWLHKFDKRFNVEQEIVSWPSNGVGIAGGCIFINTSVWKKINGYKVLGVYASDDAMMMRDTIMNGFGIAVIESIYAFHPDTHNDPDFHNFKTNTLKYQKTYDQARLEIDHFWNNRKKKERLYLPSVTLAIVDCLDLKRAVKAVEYSKRNIDFGDVKILTSIQNDNPNSVKIDCIRSKEEYSFFCIKMLRNFISTPYVILIQYDGFIINHEAWNDEFLKYDYIGAPWGISDGADVGNGGFSLRSKKLLDALQDTYVNNYHPEDFQIGRTYRDFLEKKYGIKFPSSILAQQFSFECNARDGFYLKGKIPFGFHGTDVLKYNNIRIFV